MSMIGLMRRRKIETEIVVATESVQYYLLDCIYRNVFVFIQALTIQRLYGMMCLLKP